MKHLDKKYFRYRGDIVGRAQAAYPQRAKILAFSEYLRLGFILAGAILCALIFGVLAVMAVGRIGVLEWRTVTFAIITLFAAWVAARVLWSMLAKEGSVDAVKGA